MKLKLTFSTIALMMSGVAYGTQSEWTQSEHCNFVMAPHVYSDGVAMLNLDSTGKIWLAFPGSIASEQDRQSTEIQTDKVLTINGIKLKAAAEYHPDMDLVMVTPYTAEGVQAFRTKVEFGEQVTIKYNRTTINAKYPSLSEGEKSISNCKKPI